MKKKLTLLLLSVVSILAVVFAGCTSAPKETMRFTDFKKYKSFNAQVSSVYLTDDGGGREVKMNIEDEETVNKIIDYYLNATFYYEGESPFDGFSGYVGNNTYLHFVYEGGNELSVNTAVIYEDGHNYKYSDSELSYIVNEIIDANADLYE